MKVVCHRAAVKVAIALAFLLAGPAVANDAEDSAWAEILRARINNSGEVSYRTLAAFDGERIDRYVRSLAVADPKRMARDERIAFWINAYNAMVVYAVTRGESPETLASRARLYHWFRLDIAGERRTLDEIHGVVSRYASVDPRIHFAVCNGSRDAPRLALQPYRGGELDAALASAAREFTNDPRRNHFDISRRQVELSSVFAWNRSDFERAAGSLAGYLQGLLLDPQAAAMIAAKDLPLGFRDFDWTLNAATGERPR